MEHISLPSIDEDECMESTNEVFNEPSTQPLSESTQPSAQTESGPSSKKRKGMKPRSKVWDHFEKFIDEKGTPKAKCNYCESVFRCDPKVNGTSSLNSHMRICLLNPHVQQKKQSLLNLQPSGGIETSDVGTLGTWKYDQDAIRKAIAYMIIVDELPFKFIEGDGFKKLMNQACPRFKISSRWTISRDCFGLYGDEKKRLKSFMRSNCQRISITTDTWTSVQRINYMCITAHFIDNDWNLHKKILNFVPISSHKGDYIGKSIESCLLEWGLKNVFTITVDNASSNDTALVFLKRKMLSWEDSVGDCKYLHMRCIAHVINLVVSEGLKDVNVSVKRVREAVRYIRSSPARINKFKECVEYEGISCQSSLCLDVATRWNSTYLMLSTALKFEKAFERYEDQESAFVSDLGREGVPNSQDWVVVKRISDLLHYFYVLTLRISGSLYVTSNTSFSEISDLCCVLNEWCNSVDFDVKRLGESMKTKFEKYWGDPDKMNKIIFWANILDPRDKVTYMEYSFCEMYGEDKGKKLFQNVEDELVALFHTYKARYFPENDVMNASRLGSSSGSIVTQSNVGAIARKPASLYKQKFIQKVGGIGECKKSEIEIYLTENNVVDAENFDILKWWKLNSERFPVLSKMARDIMAVPISTVASESAFSTGGRVLDAFRSSLTPRIVEGLICAQDWLRNSKVQTCVEEIIEELENHEKDLPKVGVGES